MATILMYNPANQHMQELQDSETDIKNRLMEGGFRQVDKYELVAMFNPNLNSHKTVLRTDIHTWLNQGYYAEPTFVYHPDSGSKVVSGEEAAYLLENGWYDSPAKFSEAAKQELVEAAVKQLRDEEKTKGGKKAASAA